MCGEVFRRTDARPRLKFMGAMISRLPHFDRVAPQPFDTKAEFMRGD
jgi:hypothetical protein